MKITKRPSDLHVLNLVALENVLLHFVILGKIKVDTVNPWKKPAL